MRARDHIARLRRLIPRAEQKRRAQLAGAKVRETARARRQRYCDEWCSEMTRLLDLLRDRA